MLVPLPLRELTQSEAYELSTLNVTVTRQRPLPKQYVSNDHLLRLRL